MDGGDGSGEIKKGTWSSEEDSLLVNYIAIHGEGRWNYVARDSGLRRTGKSCRLRWKNYLQPNVRRGNFTVEEQLCIVELHCIFGNRWSKIAEFLPGRTDNEIKNYWRSRVHKQGKQLKYDTNSVELREFVHNHNIFINSEIVPTETDHSCNGTMTEPTRPEALQMDHNWPNLSEAHQLDDLFKNSDDPTPFELDIGQHYYCNNPYNGYGLQGSDSHSPAPALFDYEELSNLLLNEDYNTLRSVLK